MKSKRKISNFVVGEIYWYLNRFSKQFEYYVYLGLEMSSPGHRSCHRFFEITTGEKINADKRSYLACQLQELP